MNGETDVYKEVDETIVCLCGWIKKTSEDVSPQRTELMPEMTKALAELVSARAQMRSQKDVKEMEAVVKFSDGQCGFVERYHTEKELREAVMPLLDERVISVDITKRAPERGPSQQCPTSME